MRGSDETVERILWLYYVQNAKRHVRGHRKQKKAFQGFHEMHTLEHQSYRHARF